MNRIQGLLVALTLATSIQGKAYMNETLRLTLTQNFFNNL